MTRARFVDRGLGEVLGAAARCAWRWSGAAFAVFGLVSFQFTHLAANALAVRLSGSAVFGALIGLKVSLTLKRKQIEHGSDRRTEEGASDPAPYTFTINGSGPVDLTRYLAFGTSTGLAPVKGSEKQPEIVQSDMPILAHRIATLWFNGTSKPFGSLNRETWFGVDADAGCRNQYSFGTYRTYGSYTSSAAHHSPALGCSCGFYAIPSDVEPWNEGVSFVTLMVELSGTVIEHEKGYRAQHQRVVECQLPPCRYCGGEAEVLDVRDGAMFDATCKAHQPANPVAGAVTMSVDDVRAVLPVPVTCLSRVTS